MIITKFASNDEGVLADVDPGLRMKPESFPTKVLGLPWDPHLDLLSCDVPSAPEFKACNKLNILIWSHRIFDPLGVLIPVTIRAKLILQTCWRDKLDWEDPVPRNLEEEWNDWTQAVSYTHLTLPTIYSV